MAHTSTIDDSPLTGFHIRVATYTTGGMFCDGYILGMIGIALTLIQPQMHLSPTWQGLIGASALIGIFFGSITLGWLADRIGRQVMYLADLALFVVGSVLQFFVDAPWQLFALRVLMGIAVGADYAIGAALLSEFIPRRHRGPLLASLNAVWTVGYVASYIIGDLFSHMGGDVWRWLLASSALPALIVMTLRLGTPESPRWLLRHGRAEEARDIARRFLGCDIGDLALTEQPRSPYRTLFGALYRKRLAFAGLFWFAQVAPFFAISTFLPQILKGINLTDAFIGTLIYNLFQLSGAVVGVLIMNKLPRRRFVIGSFGIMFACLLVLGIWPATPLPVVVACFVVFAFVVSAAGNIETVYPSEIFPTDVRASGVGIAAAISRVGAAAGTFLLPLGLSTIGLRPSMLIGAAVLAMGLAVSVAWAPETRELTLSAASTVPAAGPAPAAGTAPAGAGAPAEARTAPPARSAPAATSFRSAWVRSRNER